MKTALFDFQLPDELIAQQPLPDRDASRLLVIDRKARAWRDQSIRDFPNLLQPGDLLVLNDTRVIPARLRATRERNGRVIEILLLPPETNAPAAASAGAVVRRVMTKLGNPRPKKGELFTLTNGATAAFVERLPEGHDLLEFQCDLNTLLSIAEQHGEIPLPPYIQRPAGPSSDLDRARYQTVFAQTPGAVAAPTAGLHFTPALFEALRARGVALQYLTLHVGPGTFRPVKAVEVEAHHVDPEPFEIPAATVAAVQRAKAEGRRVIAVGTTSLRTLEGSGILSAPPAETLRGAATLYVYPPFQFKVVDALLTNFHLPQSSLLMLASAFAEPGGTGGVELMQRAYAHAIAGRYRFYSYGDACLLL